MYLRIEELWRKLEQQVNADNYWAGFSNSEAGVSGSSSL